MNTIRLTAGENWAIGSERYVLDQVMGNGLLHLRCERTGAPLQVRGEQNDLVCPSSAWLVEQFAAGQARRIDLKQAKSSVRKGALAFGGDYEMIVSRDPSATFRLAVITSLDRIASFSRSADGIRKALAVVWSKKPEFFSGKKPPSPTTVRRWLADRGDVGERPLKAMVNMSGKVPRKHRLPASVRRRMHEEATAYWADHKKSLGDAYDDLCEHLGALNKWIRQRSSRWMTVPVPAKETFRKYVRSIECYETVAAKFGKKVADQRFKACGQGLASQRPLMLGAMDHTQVDYHVVINSKGWRLLGRPWLTIILDVYTRCIVGWVLSFEPPSLYSVTECIKRANRPKIRMGDRFPEKPELVSIHGKFDEIVVDNGWEFTGTSFESAMIDMGVSVRWAPVRSPTYKAVIERLFGTLNTRLHRKMPGGTFPVAQLREWGLDPRKDAVLTLQQAEDLLISAIGIYHQELHSTLGEAPVTAWDRKVREQGGVQVIGEDSQLDRMLGARRDATLTRSGVNLFNLQYQDPAITGRLLENLARREPRRGQRKGSATAKVVIKYNPANLGQIYIWCPGNGEFVALPCIDPEYAEGLCKWRHDLIEAWSREEKDSTKDDRRRRRIELRREIEAETPVRVLTRNKRTQARLLASPKVEAMAKGSLRIEYAEARHDGMAPTIPTVALAPERTDDHVKPVRPARGGKPKTKRLPKAEPVCEVSTESGWAAVASSSDEHWEAFQ